jgi:hypothetical protein
VDGFWEQRWVNVDTHGHDCGRGAPIDSKHVHGLLYHGHALFEFSSTDISEQCTRGGTDHSHTYDIHANNMDANNGSADDCCSKDDFTDNSRSNNDNPHISSPYDSNTDCRSQHQPNWISYSCAHRRAYGYAHHLGANSRAHGCTHHLGSDGTAH